MRVMRRAAMGISVRPAFSASLRGSCTCSNCFSNALLGFRRVFSLTQQAAEIVGLPALRMHLCAMLMMFICQNHGICRAYCTMFLNRFGIVLRQ